MKKALDDFIEYAKETHGVDITAEKSDTPDTFGTFFGKTSPQSQMPGMQEPEATPDAKNKAFLALGGMFQPCRWRQYAQIETDDPLDQYRKRI